MAEETRPQGTDEPVAEPRGFGEHSRGLAGEYAHEQGWGLNEAERTAKPEGRQPEFGGTDYEYGARDFGDEPQDTSAGDGTGSKLEHEVEKALGGTTQAGGERTKTTDEPEEEQK